jgi:hypothetical protein
MHSPRRPLTALIAVAALALALAVTSVALGSPVKKDRASTSAKSNASVGVLACKSARYASDRSFAFRAKMFAYVFIPGVDDKQKLEMRVEVWRKLNEDTRFRKFKVDGFGTWKAADDPAATGYQRDFNLQNVETAARYRAKVFFKWSDATTGVVVARHTVWSKTCKQKVALPSLKITLGSAVPIPGSTDLTHTLTVANTGGSEAVNVPVAVFVDNGAVVSKTVDSFAPKQTTDIEFRVPACTNTAYAVIDPFKTIARLQSFSREHFPLGRCH